MQFILEVIGEFILEVIFEGIAHLLKRGLKLGKRLANRMIKLKKGKLKI